MANNDFVDWRSLDPKERIELAQRSTGPFFVTGEDGIELAALNSATGVTLTLAGRFMQLNGEVTSFNHSLTPTTDRTLTSKFRALGDGWILNFNVVATAGAPTIGQCWARVNILRGDGGATTLLGTLVSGYVTAVQTIAFPGGRARGTLDSPGAIRVITGTNPAAGAEISETVPTGARWRIQNIWTTLVTNATVANRFPVLVIDDGATEYYRASPSSSLPASQTGWWMGSAAPFGGATATNVFAWALPPSLTLLAGHRIRTATSSLQAADDWAAPILNVEEWLQGI